MLVCGNGAEEPVCCMCDCTYSWAAVEDEGAVAAVSAFGLDWLDADEVEASFVEHDVWSGVSSAES